MHFNPRTHVGCDHAAGAQSLSLILISIHAPTWGATVETTSNLSGYPEFQSTHPRGVRPSSSLCNSLQALIFQSTHPRGVRQQYADQLAAPFNFNPRTHVGCDAEACKEVRAAFEFQSTHPRGVRRYFAASSVEISYFNPRTHVGCDIRPVVFLQLRQKFQSTHPRGVRQLGYRRDGQMIIFQSTHPRGVRPLTVTNIRLFFDFNPRTHVGCDSCQGWRLISEIGFQSTHPRGVRLL